MAKDLGIHAAVPARLSMLLTGPEYKVLEPVIDEFDPAAFKMVAALERTVRDAHRIVKGVHSSGTFEFRRPGHRDDDETEDIDALAFCRSEFPALLGEWGNVMMDGDEPVEFILTSRFTAVLFATSKRRGGGADGTRLLVRRGTMETAFFAYGTPLTSIADALIAVEQQSPAARRWLDSVATEIAECNLLTTT